MLFFVFAAYSKVLWVPTFLFIVARTEFEPKPDIATVESLWSLLYLP